MNDQHNVSLELVDKIANSAQLHITEETAKTYQKDLNKIVDLIEQLQPIKGLDSIANEHTIQRNTEKAQLRPDNSQSPDINLPSLEQVYYDTDSHLFAVPEVLAGQDQTSEPSEQE